MQVQEAPSSELPEDATHGFYILDEEGSILMFFHWHQDGEVQIPPTVAEGEGEDLFEIVHDPRKVTTYADALKALPDRLKSMGHEDEAASIQGQVIGMFGAGA